MSPREPRDHVNGKDAAKDRIDRSIDEGLGALGAADSAPPLGDELERELARLEPTRPRRPRRQLAVIVVASLLYAAGLALLSGLRRDLGALPPWYLVGVGSLWLGSFATVSWLVLVPPARSVMPRWRAAAALSGASAVALIACGLLVAPAAPESTLYDPSAGAVLAHAGCIRWGLAGAVLPIALAVLAVRGAIPVGSRAAAAAVGAAGGALGGLVLHLHCPIMERFHLGLVHGGLVVAAAILTAVLARVGVPDTAA